MILVIGGPKNGELVDWPPESMYWRIPSNRRPVFTDVQPTEVYRLHKIVMFKYLCPLWVHESIPYNDEDRFADLLLAEILSFKGATMIASGRKQDYLEERN